MGPAGWIPMLIWIAVLLFMVWLLVQPTRQPAEDAMAILRSRFARGEITQAEYHEARSTLLTDQETTR